MAVQKLLCEDLAALQLSARFRRAHDSQPASRKFIGYAGDQRLFGANDCQVGAHTPCQLSHSFGVTQIDGYTFRHAGNPTVAGSAENTLDRRALQKLPNQSVLASAAAKY